MKSSTSYFGMAGRFMLLPVLAIALFTLSVSGQFIASINCGASHDILDLNLITWTPDEKLVSNGDARSVKPINSISTVLDTLRVFTSRKKNCYSIPVTKGNKVLIRASFNYGNYDSLSNPPTFDLHFDGNFWVTVETKISGVVRYEITYVPKQDFISVCVAQITPGQFPFISAIEVRRLDSDVYREVDESRVFFLLRRISFGASQNIRYPYDMYDRIWRYPANIVDTVTNSASFVDTTTAPNNPPSEIFEKAMTGVGTVMGLFLATVSPSVTPIYANMYFSEVSSLTILKRSFMVFEDNSTSPSSWLPSSTPILPPYGSVIVQSFYNYSVNSMTDLYLGATNNSDLPPIISAMEVFQISDVLNDGTDTKDVKALSLLQSTFDVLGGWSGDPCLPAPYSWDWLNCSNDPTSPRVTSLNLASFNLSGSLPDVSSMDALMIIDLHNNSLKGTIPSFLGTMPNLQQLNLADNQFSGSIPTSLSTNKKVTLNVTGNPSLCTPSKSCSSSPADNTPGTKKKKKSMLHLILFITIAVLVIVLLVLISVIAYCCLRKKPPNPNTPVVPEHIPLGVIGTSGGVIGNPVRGRDQQFVDGRAVGYLVPKGGVPSRHSDTHALPDN